MEAYSLYRACFVISGRTLPVFLLHFLMLPLFIAFVSTAVADQKVRPPKYNEADLKKSYEAFLIELDYVKVATDYPKTIKDLLSGNAEKQTTAFKVLGESADPAVIPWLVPYLDSADRSLRTWAGCSIEKVISTCALKRRDMQYPGKVVLRDTGEGEPDLRPFAWVALKMFRTAEDGNLESYAATITRYLELKEFEDELRKCLRSRHPAVSNAAKFALEALGLEDPRPKVSAEVPRDR